jgi:hypothetical protein
VFVDPADYEKVSGDDLRSLVDDVGSFDVRWTR